MLLHVVDALLEILLLLGVLLLELLKLLLLRLEFCLDSCKIFRRLVRRGGSLLCCGLGCVARCRCCLFGEAFVDGGFFAGPEISGFGVGSDCAVFYEIGDCLDIDGAVSRFCIDRDGPVHSEFGDGLGVDPFLFVLGDLVTGSDAALASPADEVVEVDGSVYGVIGRFEVPTGVLSAAFQGRMDLRHRCILMYRIETTVPGRQWPIKR